MLFDIHSDLFMDVDNRRVAGSRNAIAENHSERLKAGGVTSMLAPLFINPYKKDVMHQKARSMFKSMCAELNDHKDSVVVAKCAQDFTDAEQQGKLALIDDPETLDVVPLKAKSLSLHWEFMFTRSMFETDDMIAQHQLLTRVAALIDNHTIKTALGEHYGAITAANLQKAHRQLETGRAVGKIVLEGF